MACKIDFWLASAVLIAGLLHYAAGAAADASEHFQTNLGPMPLDAATRVNIQGRGDAIATLEGRTLTISGSFGRLTSPATEAHVYMSPYIGVPGKRQQMNLAVSPASSGTVAGTFLLTAKQAAALRAGKLYVQIDSQNATSGNLWGWFFPSHSEVGPIVPQQGSWFQPHIGSPQRWSSADAVGKN